MYRSQHDLFLVEQHGTSNKDLQWAIGLNRFSLKFAGIWPREVNSFNSCDFRHLRVPLMLLGIALGITLPHMFALSQIFHELSLVVDNLTTNFAALNAFIKLFLLWHKRRVLRPAIISVLNDWNNPRAFWEHMIMIKQARRARIFTISGLIIMFTCFSGFILSPFIGVSIRIINNITDPVVNRYLPLQGYYPYDATISPYYELTYVSQLVAGLIAGFSLTVPDNFFGLLVFHACAQSEILGLRMSKLMSKDKLFRWMESRQKLFWLKLREIVDTHEQLIRFTNTVESSFNLLILAQVVCISVNICCLGFGVLTALRKENKQLPIVQIFTLGGTALNLMIHMLVYCIASEILANHSLGFIDAIYYSDWYFLPPKYSQNIVPIMIRSKYPLQLTAGKFFYLSLNSYLSILKSSFGYISILLAVENQ